MCPIFDGLPLKNSIEICSRPYYCNPLHYSWKKTDFQLREKSFKNNFMYTYISDGDLNAKQTLFRNNMFINLEEIHFTTFHKWTED